MLKSVLLVSALLTSAPAPAAAEEPVRFLGEHVLPMGLQVGGSAVGGLSGLDYDHRTRKWIIISDDRVSPRFFEADLSRKGVEFTGVRPLNAEGGPYAPGVVDPEDVRVDRWTGDIVWSQEGNRTADVLSDPFVQFTKRDGSFRRTLPTPDDLKMRPESGPRGNASLEGLTFAAGGTRVVSAVEGPLLQDGPPADERHGAVSRVVVQSRHGHVLAQYRYQQEPLFAPGADTGVVAILEKRGGVYLVLERSFAQGVGNKVRLFEARPDGSSLRKRLLADLDDFPLSNVDNVEGMAWGPDGTLWLVSDNNFSSTQITQFIALDVR
ncbi:esterase-like activity of phytase family protein [Lentzea sp. NPDC051208]|uniref:esterase-like activity of phytase family protein n=1 Tax=Lentzea sp. NPDC051208 TaxID=3154642 RepID=UPI003438F3D4